MSRFLVTTTKLTNGIINVLLFLGTIIGLLPFEYNHEKKLIQKRSFVFRFWSITIGLFESSSRSILTVLAVIGIVKLLRDSEDFAISELISWLLALLFGLICSMPYYQVRRNRTVVWVLMNKVLELRRLILVGQGYIDLSRKLIVFFTIKLIIDIILCNCFVGALIFDTIIRSPTPKVLLENVSGAIGTYVYAFVIETFYAGNLLVAHCLEVINLELEFITQMVEKIKNNRLFYLNTSTIIRFVDISKRINKLAEQQNIIEHFRIMYVSIYESTLLVIFGNIFIAIVMQVCQYCFQ